MGIADVVFSLQLDCEVDNQKDHFQQFFASLVCSSTSILLVSLLDLCQSDAKANNSLKKLSSLDFSIKHIVIVGVVRTF